MDWLRSLRDILPPGLGLKFTSECVLLVSLFKDVVEPQISTNHLGKICFPDQFSVTIGGSRGAFVALLQSDVFHATPQSFQQTLLDLLFLIFKGNVYNVIRFQCTSKGRGATEYVALMPLLILLLQQCIQRATPLSVSKRVIHLIGLSGAAGMNATDLKSYLNFLRKPSELSVSLLQALKIFLGQDHITSEVRVKKASPAAVFDFGGSGAGLQTHFCTFPFSREFQFCTWFRVENFESSSDGNSSSNGNGSSKGDSNGDRNSDAVQHIFTWQNSAFKGLDIYLDQRMLTVAVNNSTSKVEPSITRLTDCSLQRGVWYHITVRHAKPRLSLFSSDELTVHIEDRLVFQENVRFPALTSPDVKFSFGTNLDGQMAPIYLFSESLPAPAVHVVASLDAGRPMEGIDSGFNPAMVDLLPHITTSGKTHTLLSRVQMAYHPSRCMRGHALDVHSGRHALMGARTQCWTITNARDLLNSMGGLSCILPMFPRLLIENETHRSPKALEARSLNPASTPSRGAVGAVGAGPGVGASDDFMGKVVENYSARFTGLGDTLADLGENWPIDRDLDSATMRLLRSEKEEYLGEGSVGLLLSVLAKCIVAHRINQQELVNVGGIEMIEYALTCTPQEIMQGEGERCVYSLRELQKSASDLPTLEHRVTKCLLCNFSIWHRASFELVRDLMAVILKAIHMKAGLFVHLMGVKPVLDSLEFFNAADQNADEGRPVMAPINSNSNGPNSSSSQTPYTDTDAHTEMPVASAPRARALSAESGGPDPPSPAGGTGTGTGVEVGGSEGEEAFSPIALPTPERKNGRRIKSFKLALTEVIKESEEGMGEEGRARLGASLGSVAEQGEEEGDEYEEESGEESAHALSGLLHADLMPAAALTPSMPPAAPSPASVGDDLHERESRGRAFVPLLLMCDQRKGLRDCLEAMVVALVLHGGTEKEVNPLLDYLVLCKDRVVLNEIAQILLYLIVERRFLPQIVQGCCGLEEFASLVLLYLVHQPYEELRRTGIRILTHLYSRIDQAPPSVLSLSLRQKRREGPLQRAIAGTQPGGLHRLQACGGLALLCEILSSHSKASSELTYSALLEVLLTKPGARCQGLADYAELVERGKTPSPERHSPQLFGRAQRTTSSNFSGSGTGSLSGSQALGRAGSGLKRPPLLFAVDYLRLDQAHDESVNMINVFALPVFCELLPKLPVHVQGHIYEDLLALVKHSEGNCQAFCSSYSWHLCMFGLVSQLVSLDSSASAEARRLNSHTLLAELERWTAFGGEGVGGLAVGVGGAAKRPRSGGHAPQGELMRGWRQSDGQMGNNTSFSYSSEGRPATKQRLFSSLSQGTGQIQAHLGQGQGVEDAEVDYDLWFALGMKIYATLLLHAMQSKAGWRELDRSVSQSYESDLGYSVAQTVLSHVLNELTFRMRSKYRELQRLAKSSDRGEVQEATDKIENFLCLMLTTSQLALIDQRCALGGLKNFNVCHRRVQYHAEVSREHAMRMKPSTEAGAGGAAGDAPAFSAADLRQIGEKTEQLLARKLQLVSDGDYPGFQAVGGARAEVEDEDEDSNSYHQYLNLFHQWHDIGEDEAAASPFKSSEELLHPLERNHDLAKGKLVLVLQTLRFFDIIFWPADNGAIRNAEMMRFHKEEKEEKDKRGPSYPMTMLSAVMRMCLFIVTELSPVTHLAILNVQRMRMLVNSLDKVKYKTPTHDWLLAAVLHTTLNLQRISLSLEPVYEMLGVIDSVLVPTVGPWQDAYDDFDAMDPRDAAAFDACENSPMLLRLQQYFDSGPGRNLIRNIRFSVLLLSDALDAHYEKLSRTLEERTFKSLEALVDFYKSTNMGGMGFGGTGMGGNSPSRESVDISPQSSTSSFSSSRNSMNLFTGHAEDTSGDIFESADKPLPSPGLTRGNFANFRRTRSSEDESDSELSGASEYGSEGEGGSRRESRAVTPTPTEGEEDSFLGSDILMVLRWLRLPYFRLNPLRSVAVVKAVDALDYLEGRAVHSFAREAQKLKESLEEQQDLAVKSVEEMTELKELSRAVFDMMSARNDHRLAASETAENLKLKNVAARWHECLQTFEEDWSPWTLEEAPTQGQGQAQEGGHDEGRAHFELSKHRDLYLRRMTMTKLAQPIDHNHAAYLEGKLKDQSRFAHGLDIAEANTPAGRALLPFKRGVSATTDKNAFGEQGMNWEDDEEVEEATAPSIAGGLANLLHWNEKRPQWTHVFHWSSDERLLFESDAMQIKLDQVAAGTVVLTNKCLYFHARKYMDGMSAAHRPFTDCRWHLDRIVEAYGRRYLLQHCAIEMFFENGPELFLAFKGLPELQRFFRLLRRQALPLLVTPHSLNPRYTFHNSPWCEMWRRRQISNFEYLMRLNIMAGRSINDITQYPVFPWVLADYTSKTLDLTKDSTFRRLDRPVGALNASRLDEFLDRYNGFDDNDTVPRFMYGSHYSSAGVVLHYLVRQEPFTTLAIGLQGGRFDCPDRVFFDINRTWENCNQSMSDVKEMIPELFCCPEALLNSNKLPLGELQEGGRVDDVRLPPWADSAYEFVRLNRAALESDYVSDNMQDWIDLIFGYKQTGPNAVEAQNVFYYLTYENAVDIDSIEDPLEREAAKSQVTHFGQTPSQLLDKPHAKRLPKLECINPLCSDVREIGAIRPFTPARQLGTSNGAVIGLSCCGERVVVCHSNLSLSYYRWSALPEDTETPFTLRAERSKVLSSAALSSSEEILRGRAALMSDLGSSKSGWGKGSEKEEEEEDSSKSIFGAGMGALRKLSSGQALSLGMSMALQGRTTRTPSVALPSASSANDLFSYEGGGGVGGDQRSGSARPGSPNACPALSHMHVALRGGETGRLVSCCYWDDSLKLHGLETLREICSSSLGHQGPITCVQHGGASDSFTLLSGGLDRTCRVWIFEKMSLATAYAREAYHTEIETDEATVEGAPAAGPPLVCVHVLWGHQSPVRCISYSSVLDVVLSGGEDGRLCLHSVRNGQYVRCITHAETEGASVDLVVASCPGYLVAHSWASLRMHVFWLNGQHLLSTTMPAKIECMITDSTGLILITGSSHGILSFREIWSLEEVKSVDLSQHGAITSLAFSEDNQFLLIGSADGSFSIATDPEARLRAFDAALQKTPIMG